MKSIIHRFDRNTFEAFFQTLLNKSDSYHGQVKQLESIDRRILECSAERFYQSVDVFLMDYQPYEIYKQFTLDSLDMSSIIELAKSYITKRDYRQDAWLPIDGITLYVINNFDSEKIGICDELLCEKYEKDIIKLIDNGNYRVGTGNINTFLNSTNNQSEMQVVLSNFLEEYDEGLRISISDSGLFASRFLTQNEFSGVTQKTSSIITPVYPKIIAADTVLLEFNRLINSDTSESKLEEFIREHYQVVFGTRYDNIMTQVWIRFPDLDIGNRNRRLDIMMRNVNIGDWELFELKKSNVQLTKSESDIPKLTAEVHDAIAQAKNYKRLLEQDRVKRVLAAEGIEYYQPEINLVIGKKPSISNAQWRRLKSDNENGLKILTYDTLLKEAKDRLSEIEDYLN
jgi:hypothetical protein